MLRRTAVAVLLLSSLLFARNKAGAADGSDWKQWPVDYKVGWIDGWSTAMSHAEITTVGMCAFQLHLNADTKQGKVCIEQSQSFDFEEIKYGQYLEGMDVFYKDFRNAEYPIAGAIKLVRDEIRGRPAEDIEKELVEWRQCHADASKCLTPPPPK